MCPNAVKPAIPPSRIPHFFQPSPPLGDRTRPACPRRRPPATPASPLLLCGHPPAATNPPRENVHRGTPAAKSPQPRRIYPRHLPPRTAITPGGLELPPGHLAACPSRRELAVLMSEKKSVPTSDPNRQSGKTAPEKSSRREVRTRFPSLALASPTTIAPVESLSKAGAPTALSLPMLCSSPGFPL